MKSDSKTLCLQINRRSSLALFMLFLVAYSNEISLTLGGAILLVATCSYIPKQTEQIENQIDTLRIMIQDMRAELVTNDIDCEMDREY